MNSIEESQLGELRESIEHAYHLATKRGYGDLVEVLGGLRNRFYTTYCSNCGARKTFLVSPDVWMCKKYGHRHYTKAEEEVRVPYELGF